MDKSYSIILDLIRFSAALLVFFHHAEIAQFKVRWLSPLASFGHDSVIVFFVLSGYVIAFVADTKEKTWQLYLASRMARILSVTLPALLLTVFLMCLAINGVSDLDRFRNDQSWAPLTYSLLFLNQTSLNGGVLDFNGPYWSINYEVWYYAIFGVLIFSKGLVRVALLVAASFIAGIRILLLFPIWLSGVALYYHQKKRNGNNSKKGIALLIFSIPIYIAIRATNIDDLIYRATADFIFGSLEVANSLAFSKLFIRDYIILVLTLIAFRGAHLMRHSISSRLKAAEGIIRKGAGMSFTLYLFHWPLLVIFSTVFENGIVILATTFAASIIFSTINNNLWNTMRRNFNEILGLSPKKHST